MFVLFFVLWIIFNGRLTWEIAAFGVVLSAVMCWFCAAFLDYHPKKDARFIRLIPRILRYLGLLVREIIKSNMALIRVVYSRKAEVQPKLITFQTPLRRSFKSVLADSITVTPGTISVHSEEDRLTVHCLDTVFAEGIEDTDFQKQLLEMQQKEGDA